MLKSLFKNAKSVLSVAMALAIVLGTGVTFALSLERDRVAAPQFAPQFDLYDGEGERGAARLDPSDTDNLFHLMPGMYLSAGSLTIFTNDDYLSPVTVTVELHNVNAQTEVEVLRYFDTAAQNLPFPVGHGYITGVLSGRPADWQEFRPGYPEFDTLYADPAEWDPTDITFSLGMHPLVDPTLGGSQYLFWIGGANGGWIREDDYLYAEHGRIYGTAILHFMGPDEFHLTLSQREYYYEDPFYLSFGLPLTLDLIGDDFDIARTLDNRYQNAWLRVDASRAIRLLPYAADED